MKITRAIDNLRYMMNELSRMNAENLSHEIIVKIRTLRTAIEELEKQSWIPVTERLPDVPEGTKDEDCPEFIVTIAGAEKPTSLKCDPEGTWFDDFGNVYSVYAWMPLPEAYRIEY